MSIAMPCGTTRVQVEAASRRGSPSNFFAADLAGAGGLDPHTSRCHPASDGSRPPDRFNALIWYARRDSNPHGRRSENRASYPLGYARLVLEAGFEPALDGFPNRFLCRIGIPELVRLLGFEPRLNTL